MSSYVQLNKTSLDVHVYMQTGSSLILLNGVRKCVIVTCKCI